MGTIITIAVIFGGMWFYARWLRSPKRLGKQYGFPSDDSLLYWWYAENPQGVGAGKRVGAALVGAMFGSIVTLRPSRGYVAVSSRGWLTIDVESEENKLERRTFSPTDGTKIEYVGQGDRKVGGYPSVQMRFSTSQGEQLNLLLPENAREHLARWPVRHTPA